MLLKSFLKFCYDKDRGEDHLSRYFQDQGKFP